MVKMSVLLIILLVLAFLILVATCIVIIVWLAMGTPNVSVQTLDLAGDEPEDVAVAMTQPLPSPPAAAGITVPTVEPDVSDAALPLLPKIALAKFPPLVKTWAVPPMTQRRSDSVEPHDAHQYHLQVVSGRPMCHTSSHLDIPLRLQVPNGMQSLQDRSVRWLIYDGAVLLWQSEPQPLRDGDLTLWTQLSCAAMANRELRLTLVVATPGYQHHNVLCSTKFVPAAHV